MIYGGFVSSPLALIEHLCYKYHVGDPSFPPSGVLYIITGCLVALLPDYLPLSLNTMPSQKSSLTNPQSKISNPNPHRGAPLGNLNALKHGFYSRRFKKSDLVGLEECDFDGLKDEITIMRVFIRRFIEQCSDSTGLYETAGILRILCQATVSLTRLIKTKTQHLLVSDPDDLFGDLRQALEEVNQEMRAEMAQKASSLSSDPQSSAAGN